MKIRNLLATLALGLVIGVPASVSAQQTEVDTGTVGWTVNAQVGTTNQGEMARGMPGIVIGRFGGPSRHVRAYYHRTRTNQSRRNRRSGSQEDLLSGRYGDNPYGYNF